MATHPPDCECDTYGCVLRRKGVGVAPSATPGRHNRRAPRPHSNNWEKGIAGEHRPGGSFMPYLDGTGERIGVKAFAQNRRKLTEARRVLANTKEVT